MVPAWREQVASKMWSEQLQELGLKVDGKNYWVPQTARCKGSRLGALLEHLEEEDRGPGGEASQQVCYFCCITLVQVLDEDTFRRLAATTVIDAMDSRGRGKVVFDDSGKAALACVMRAYGYELPYRPDKSIWCVLDNSEKKSI